jgi:hypothetical protein
MTKKTEKEKKEYSTIRVKKTTQARLKRLDSKNMNTAIEELLEYSHRKIIDVKKTSRGKNVKKANKK